jgi:hypothetical protein
MADEPIKGPASYFPSIEKKYGKPIAEWQDIVRRHLPAKHMDLVAMLKNDHGMDHGHANALVAHTLATNLPLLVPSGKLELTHRCSPAKAEAQERNVNKARRAPLPPPVRLDPGLCRGTALRSAEPLAANQ